MRSRWVRGELPSAELKDPRWKALCKRLKWELAPVCGFCGGHIDRSLSGRSPNGWTLDHIIPRHQAPQLVYDVSNLRPAHHHCNSSRGGAPENVVISQNWGDSRHDG